MRIVRICRAKHPDLDGKGAAIVGGRWNSLGTHVVYTSSCGALAVLEYRVHALEDPADLLVITLEVDDTLAIERSARMPDVPAARRFGDSWIKRALDHGQRHASIPDERTPASCPAGRG